MYPRREQPHPINCPPGIISRGSTLPPGANNGPNSSNMHPDYQTQDTSRIGSIDRPLALRMNGRQYSLQVVQQPIRARMCGFGDKDRRPITPPPCVRLIVTDVATGSEIPLDDIDSQHFVLTVDLWNSDGNQEVNLVRHNSNTANVTISTGTTESYPPPPERHLIRLETYQPTYQGQVPLPPPGYMAVPAPAAYGMPPSTESAPTLASQHPPPPPPPQFQAPGHNPYAAPPPGAPGPGGSMISFNVPNPPPPVPPPGYMLQMSQTAAVQPNNSMFTRNLIGSLSVNAFKLVDTTGKTGFWFVLQDLSVRTEGWFRLKMNFTDVGENGPNGRELTRGKAPILASCFSDQFQVYSAKKFPGVIESTPLSKKFASQGIKIPIRKDAKGLQNDDDDEDD